MNRAPRWRVSAGYAGAGPFLVTAERVIVGTETGVACLPRGGSTALGWCLDLGSRALGVTPGLRATLLVSVRRGLHVLTQDGGEVWGTHSLEPVVRAACVFRGGVLLFSAVAIHFLREWRGVEWSLGLGDVLGRESADVRVLNAFELDGQLVVAAVDARTAVGRVAVLHGRSGHCSWLSDEGPITDAFPTGQSVFAWCQEGEGRAETRLTRVDGYEIWKKDFAGMGVPRSDGSLGLLVGPGKVHGEAGSQYLQLSPGGKLERRVPVPGRSISRPISVADGSVYWVGATAAERRGDAQACGRVPEPPWGELQGLLLGLERPRACADVWLERLGSRDGQVEILFHGRGTHAWGELRWFAGEIIFNDGGDIVGVEA